MAPKYLRTVSLIRRSISPSLLIRNCYVNTFGCPFQANIVVQFVPIPRNMTQVRDLTFANTFTVKHLSQTEAITIDQELFNEYAFSVDQLMELAGLSVAVSVAKSYSDQASKESNVLVICGPGNNGGDGLVAARHLTLFGYKPIIFYPKQGKGQLFQNLVSQCKKMDIEFVSDFNSIEWSKAKIIVDALFGFSYRPPLRADSGAILQKLSSLDGKKHKLVSVDIPSGWNVEEGPATDGQTPVLHPDCLVSLTAPKSCATHFTGKYHWLGGRFVPPSLAAKYNLNLPSYEGTEQCLLLNRVPSQ